jgi:tetratricopeptide (TPR) repeat protein
MSTKPKPRVFIGSSVEGLSVAYAIQQNLTHDVEATIWSQGVFDLSRTPMESLITAVNTNDFAIFVFSPDDIVTLRGETNRVVRDNVLFEMGLFTGKLGRDRVYFISPDKIAGQEELHLPTDLIGVSFGGYDSKRGDSNLEAATGPTCNQIRNQVKKLGPIEVRIEVGKPDETETTKSRGDWLKPFFEKEYEKAKLALIKDIETAHADAKENYRAWVLYCDYKIDQSAGFQPLRDYSRDNPLNPDIQQLVALFMRWEQHVDDAIDFLKGLDPAIQNDPTILIALAESYVATGDFASAVASIPEQAYLTNADLATHLADMHTTNNDASKAFEVCRAALVKSPNSESLRYKSARLAADLGHQKIAAYLLDRLLDDFPRNGDYWGYLGNACLALDLNDQAIYAYRRADKIFEGTAEWIQGNIGNLLVNRGLPSEALAPLKRAIELDGESQYSLQKLAKALTDKEEERKKLTEFCKEGKLLLRRFGQPTPESAAASIRFSTLLTEATK